MLPLYTLTVDFTAPNTSFSEKEFRELVAPCVVYLDALKGAFDKKSCSVTYYPPQEDTATGWSARCVLMISLGKERAVYLMQLYEAIVNLIVFELPDFEIRAESGKFQFS